MLILTRRVHETIKIGSDITIAVLDIKGSQVRLGIAAPKNIAVYRAEVCERIKREDASEPV
jgi:carbon storage regulator